MGIFTLSPEQLSARAIANIESCPAAYYPGLWHTYDTSVNQTGQFIHPCGTAHCYAGHVDLIIGIPESYTSSALYNNVQDILWLTDAQWHAIINENNTIARIKAFHKKFFVDGVFGDRGFDEEGFNEYKGTTNGFNKYGGQWMSRW